MSACWVGVEVAGGGGRGSQTRGISRYKDPKVGGNMDSVTKSPSCCASKINKKLQR